MCKETFSKALFVKIEFLQQWMKFCMSIKINQCCKQTLREWNHFNSCCIKKSLRVQLPGLQFDQNLGKSDRRDRFVQTFRSGQHQDSLDRSESCYHRSLEPSVKQMTHRFSFKSNKLTPRKWLGVTALYQLIKS